MYFLLYQRVSLLHAKHATLPLEYIRACARGRKERERVTQPFRHQAVSMYKKNTSHFPIAQRASFAVTQRMPATLPYKCFLKSTSSFLQSTSYKSLYQNLTSAPLALNQSHLPPVTYFLNRSIILHITHTLFGPKVHSLSSRTPCCLAGKRTQNLGAILLLLPEINF